MPDHSSGMVGLLLAEFYNSHTADSVSGTDNFDGAAAFKNSYTFIYRLLYTRRVGLKLFGLYRNNPCDARDPESNCHFRGTERVNAVANDNNISQMGCKVGIIA